VSKKGKERDKTGEEEGRGKGKEKGERERRGRGTCAYFLSDKTPCGPMTVDQLPSSIHEDRVPRVLRWVINKLHPWLVIGALRVASQRLAVQARVTAT